jgi:uncharacterized membrane protein YqgA involved in biofilm formation
MTGTVLNVATVTAGSCVGLLLGRHIPERVRETVLKGLGLLVLVIGMQMALKTANVLILMGSILIGGVVGEGLNLQAGLDRVGEALKGKLAVGGTGRFTEGFVTASLVFCVGPMTILGSIQDGLSGDYELLAVKSMLDGFAALAFAATFGIGVAFSAFTVLVYQGALTLGAGAVEGLLSDRMVAEMTAAGGVMVLGIGVIILDIARPRVANFLPALVFAPVIVALVARLG